MELSYSSSPLQCNASIPGHRVVFGCGGYYWISKDNGVPSLYYGKIYRRGRLLECSVDLYRQRIIHEGGSGHHNRQVSLHLFPRIWSLYDESIVGRLKEGDVDKRSGEEVEDNHQVHKEMAHATSRFPQA
jgi:hypothetical protein